MDSGFYQAEKRFLRSPKNPKHVLKNAHLTSTPRQQNGENNTVVEGGVGWRKANIFLLVKYNWSASEVSFHFPDKE